MHTLSIRNCLLVCCLFAPSLVAHSAFAFPQNQANGDGSGSTSGSTSGSGSSSGGTTTGTAASSSPKSTTYVFPSNSKMNHYWLRNTFGLKALAGATFTASWNTWVINSPNEWHKNGSGWSKRFGSSLLDNGINTSALVLTSRAMHQDPIYFRCECSGVGPRTLHAVELTFMARNRSGDLTFSPPKVGSHFAGPMVTRNTIYPDRYGVSNALRGGGYYFVGSLGWNLVREFIWKKPF